MNKINHIFLGASSDDRGDVPTISLFLLKENARKQIGTKDSLQARNGLVPVSVSGFRCFPCSTDVRSLSDFNPCSFLFHVAPHGAQGLISSFSYSPIGKVE